MAQVQLYSAVVVQNQLSDAEKMCFQQVGALLNRLWIAAGVVNVGELRLFATTGRQGVEMFRNLDQGEAGDNVGLLRGTSVRKLSGVGLEAWFD